MKASPDTVRLPSGDESIPPVTILDAHGNLVRVVSAAEFREAHPNIASPRLRPAGSRR